MTTVQVAAPTDNGDPVVDKLPTSVLKRLHEAEGLSTAEAPPLAVDAQRATTTEQRNASPLRLAILLLAVLSVWGAFAMSNNANGGGAQLPLGPVGGSTCSQAVNDMHSNVPSAIKEAQRSVDSIVAENPDLAEYASQAKRDLANAAPQVHSDIDQAGHQVGC